MFKKEFLFILIIFNDLFYFSHLPLFVPINVFMIRCDVGKDFSVDKYEGTLRIKKYTGKIKI